VSFPILVDRFVADIQRSGSTALIEGNISPMPARVRVVTGERAAECLLFLWNVTPGGGGEGVRPAGEWRIQVTTATRFPLEVGRRTIVGGWHEGESVWCFWDVMRHTRFSPKSPSFQVNIRTLERAGHDGVAAQTRRTKPREVVVSISPQFLPWYIEEGMSLHSASTDARSVADLVNATPEDERELLDSSEDEAEASRRYQLVETMRAFRDARFRPAVLQAYSHQCAICEISLNLVDAAHIIPVRHPRSTDDVTNGVALCRLHHAAFDNGLVGIRPDYGVIENPQVITRLRDLGFLLGIEEFRGLTRNRLRHPRALEVRPDIACLRLGMQARNWPAEMIG
jgi:putative restriction endonuclease